MRIMRVLAIVGAGMVATAAAQATSTTATSTGPLAGQHHNLKRCYPDCVKKVPTDVTVR